MERALSTQPAAGTVPAVSAGALAAIPRARRPVVIDLRSPAEFADDHVPGAASVPLFDDAERALVGLLYTRRSPEEAFREGRAIVAAKIDALVQRIGAIAGWDALVGAGAAERVLAWTAGGMAALEREIRTELAPELAPGTIVLTCWRGGLRSRSVAALLRSIGHDVVILDGGYRAWRREVIATLESWSAPPAFVLRGLTGVGKTLVLREIERLRPGATIDLEAAASHRSSLLGMVGLTPASQRAFESRLCERIRAGTAGAVVLEGESRKVGDAIVPRTIWRALDAGTSVELRASVERRIDVLLDDYLAHPSSRDRLRAQLAQVEARMTRRVGLAGMLDGGRERELVATLLEHYYDPLYRHSERGREYAASFDATEPARAAAEIVAWIEARRTPLERGGEPPRLASRS